MGVPCNDRRAVEERAWDDSALLKADHVIDQAFERYCSESSSAHTRPTTPFDLDRILVAFNGGKDCTLMLRLILDRVSAAPETVGRLRLMYLKDPDEDTFPEVAEFVEQTKRNFNLESIEVANGDMKSALERVVLDHPEVRAIFMGTRSTDPNAGWMDHFCHTSPGWPKIDLVAPILRMSYVDVWRLIHEKHIAYCWLYEHGYTSVGTKKNTVPNPLLKLEDGTYLHADRLRNDADERLGRLKAK